MLRRAELDAVLEWLKPGAHVLEIGGGSGYQASLIAGLGCQVLSIDIADRRPPHRLYHPVQDYDGTHIPAPDGSFDVVFSSNVLEHVRALAPVLAETRRVLKPGGMEVHIVPSASWRLWTSICFCPWALRVALGAHRPVPGMSEIASVREGLHRARTRGTLKKVVLLPILPHGEYLTALSELYYYTRVRWLRFFKLHGFHVVYAGGTHLFYTGYALMPGLSLDARRALARVLGSSCCVTLCAGNGRAPELSSGWEFCIQWLAATIADRAYRRRRLRWATRAEQMECTVTERRAPDIGEPPQGRSIIQA